MFVSILRILVFVETWNLNWVCVVLEILDFEFWIESVELEIWILVLVAFWHWATAIRCCHFFKKSWTYQRGSLYNRACMFSFCIFLNLLCHFSMRFLKNRDGMLYFPSRLYNRVCIFSTFYRGWIKRGCTTTLVSLIQSQLNVFFLLLENYLILD